jgi:glutamine synthetase
MRSPCQHCIKQILSLMLILKHKYELWPEIGAEIEFYLNPVSTINSTDSALLNEQVLHMLGEKLETAIEKEKGHNQYEITIPHQKDLQLLISNIYYQRKIIDDVTKRFAYHADFSAKPKLDDYGSGMHYHITLHNIKSGCNVFASDNSADNSDIMQKLSLQSHHPYSLSKDRLSKKLEENSHLMKVISGILHNISNVCYWFFGDDHTEYLRFAKARGFMAPTNISWGGNNRTTAIRVPEIGVRRVEFRIPSPNVPTERVLLFLLWSIVDGLRKERYLPLRIYGNAYDEQYNEHTNHHLGLMPTSPNLANALRRKCVSKDSDEVNNFSAC